MRVNDNQQHQTPPRISVTTQLAPHRVANSLSYETTKLWSFIIKFGRRSPILKSMARNDKGRKTILQKYNKTHVANQQSILTTKTTTNFVN